MCTEKQSDKSIRPRVRITEFYLDKYIGKALISDDTQMTLFTATGIMLGDTRGHIRGIGERPYTYVDYSYRDWYVTQTRKYGSPLGDYQYSWLTDVPEMYSRRAPGNTCLSALSMEKRDAALDPPINNSKGCGTIMRIAPLALYYDNINVDVLDEEAIYISKITHGHPLGYLPTAVLNHILYEIMYGENQTLKEIVLLSKDAVVEGNKGKDKKYTDELERIVDLAVSLSENNDDDLTNIHKIGEGWVAEETLGIAVYCALRYKDDFSKGIIASVNHKGDSDSIGAVTGNILGAYIGYDNIDRKWIDNLELKEVIMEIAIDLCHKCQYEEFGSYKDPYWEAKYIDNRRFPKKSSVEEYEREFTLSEKYFDINNDLKEYYRSCDYLLP